MSSHTELRRDQLLVKVVSLVYLMTFITHSSKLNSLLWTLRLHSEQDVWCSWVTGTDFR